MPGGATNPEGTPVLQRDDFVLVEDSQGDFSVGKVLDDANDNVQVNLHWYAPKKGDQPTGKWLPLWYSLRTGHTVASENNKRNHQPDAYEVEKARVVRSFILNEDSTLPAEILEIWKQRQDTIIQ
jgi:hypothetical protein